jgi:hypothetical protein
MTTYQKPLPPITTLTAPFWKGVKEHRLLLQRCNDCGKFRFTPKEVCPHCASVDATWTPVSGRGKVYTYTIVHRAPNPVWQAEAPYVIAHVELDEGVRIGSNLIGCPVDQVRIGMPVRVVYEDVTPEVSLFKFRPA